ncbi:AlbA family DNA-binding domain-containing protein [Paludibaculum fermentans]|uniref:ATP-binding protein n=1 Tax=Paludibaculum fermentans TaxID=1473598 RepID=A0A7S7SJA3_PALFE|nr:ATP-binding protein [Paludibaculum fermentans]QOY87862.1 ATP-binding protein [Paludibaculum fermentans]
MMNTLTIDNLIELVTKAPEQAVFDWKTDFVLPNDDEKRGEIIKDLDALANAITSSYGFVIYGVDPRRPDPVVGITASYDDAKLQQLAKGKIDPLPEFLYYELLYGAKTVGVLQVKATRQRPHIIKVDLGKVRKGQILIRRGSSTEGVTPADLWEMYYGQSSGHFPKVLQYMEAHAKARQADADYLGRLQAGADSALRDMEVIAGVPRGSLGGKW